MIKGDTSSDAGATLIRDVLVLDGTGGPAARADVRLSGERIAEIAPPRSLDAARAGRVVEGAALALAPGFIDVHAHDDATVLRAPQMTPKLSQGVTTVVVGNCGISAAPVTLRAEPPDPMTLLGGREAFGHPTFAEYVQAVNAAKPAVNVAALVGHTALRSNHLDALDRPARPAEIAAMRAQLGEALAHGALGLSTGLAYPNARSAPTEEVVALAEALAPAGGIYCTHMRSESAAILDAIEEALLIGRRAGVRVLISHLKCAGVPNYGRSGEVLAALGRAQERQEVGWDVYPYTASSTTLSDEQVAGATDVLVTWSNPHPQAAGRRLAEVAAAWGIGVSDAVARLQPAGGVYHCMDGGDVERILRHPGSAIGSDGLPNDARPHPRLWGTFPRVLGLYVRERGVLSLPDAVRRMTGLSADRYSLAGRGYVKAGFQADLVLFDPATVADRATFEDPMQTAEGIAAVWVNGALSWQRGAATGDRAGRFLPRAPRTRPSFQEEDR